MPDCTEAALHLLERAEQVNWEELGLSEATPVRIGIHAGPFLESWIRLLARPAASAATDEGGSERARQRTGLRLCQRAVRIIALSRVRDAFVCEYIGIEQFAKDYDRCLLYRIARR